MSVKSHAATGGLATLAAIVGTALLCCRGCVPLCPAPVAPDAVKPTATHCVMVLDFTAINIPQAIVADCPLSTAMKADGKLSVVGLNEIGPDGKLASSNYGPLLTKAGGAPALLFLNDEPADNDVYCCRVPTDLAGYETVVKRTMLNVPAPDPKSREYRIDMSQSHETKLAALPDGGGEYVDDGGNRRLLSARSDAVKFAGLPKYSEHYPVFPVSEWRDINRANIFGGKDWIEDQLQHGSCVGNGWVGALRRARVAMGMKDVRLSAPHLYSQINGGRDEGAVISDGIGALKKTGVCTFDLVPEKPGYPIYTKQMPPTANEEAKDYRIDGEIGAYRCDSWAETCSALQTGLFFPVYGVMVGKNFEKFDAAGVAGHDHGPGNHCMFAEGMKKITLNGKSKWVLDNVNSWGFSWGPFHNGHTYLDEMHLFGNGDQPDVCVIRLPTRRAAEPFAPPAYKPGKKALQRGEPQIAIAA